MNRFLFLSLGILFSTLFASLSAPSSASAQSVYDDIIQTTDTLTLQAGNDSDDKIENLEEIITSVFKKEITPDGYTFSVGSTPCNFNPTTAKNWAIVQANAKYTGWQYSSKNIILYYTPELIWAPTSSFFISRSSGYPIYGFPFEEIADASSAIHSCGLTLYQGQITISQSIYQNTDLALINKYTDTNFQDLLFLSNYDVQYPENYQGLIVPDTYTPVDTTPPEFQFTYAVADKQITLYDLSNLSLDQTACYFQINPNGTQVNTELHYDCDTQNSVTHTVDEYGLYDVTLMYVTPDGLKSSIILTLDIDGSSFSDTYGYAVNDIFYKCISSELPFINFQECYNNVLIFANMLAFDRLHFGTDFTPPEGCRNLVVLGDWIGASTNTVCPMIPSYVRDVTTPFVTFLLGLLMLKFITSRGGGGFS